MRILRLSSNWSFRILLIVTFAVWCFGCGSQLSGTQSVDEGLLNSNPASSKLEAVVPPCIPFPGSDVDPCERRETWEDIRPLIETSYDPDSVLPSLKESLIRRVDWPFWAIHFVVRATAIPDSIRCGYVETPVNHWHEYEGGLYDLDDNPAGYCYFDLAVNEYLYGSGPAVLTVNTGKGALGYRRLSECDTRCLDEYARSYQRNVGIEGREWVVYLGGPRDLSSATWHIFGMDDVQRRGDGEIIVVSEWQGTVVGGPLPSDYMDENGSRLAWTLADLRVVVTNAFKAFNAETGGRAGTVSDSLGRPAPFLAVNAGPEGFNDYITSTRMLDGLDLTPAPPPPVPGEDDINPAGLSVNDVIATRVAGGVKIPGGLTDFDTPTPILEDDLTPTATLEPTASPTVEPTATAETEPTVTPEPVPTPEPVDTPTPESVVVDPTATPETAPVVEPTATPEDAVPTDTPESVATATPETEGPVGPVGPNGPEGPVGPGAGGDGGSGGGPGTG